MLGVPVVELPPNIDELIDYYIDRGINYNVNNLQHFVWDSVKDDYNDWVTACEDLVEKHDQ